jgi:hypothetical protein
MGPLTCFWHSLQTAMSGTACVSVQRAAFISFKDAAWPQAELASVSLKFNICSFAD